MVFILELKEFLLSRPNRLGEREPGGALRIDAVSLIYYIFSGTKRHELLGISP
jgi:hypothetical protein